MMLGRLLPLVNRNAFFDEAYYIANNPDVALAKVSPVKHFERYGCWEGRNPNADFDMLWFYVTEMAKVPSANPISLARKLGYFRLKKFLRPDVDDWWMAVDDLKHIPDNIRIFIQEMKVFKSSGLCDENLIRSQIPNAVSDFVRFFIRHNTFLLINPCPFFDTRWYRNKYPDVTNSAVIHYIRYGADENRDPGPSFSTSIYRAVAKLPRQANPLAHYNSADGIRDVEMSNAAAMAIPSSALVPPNFYTTNGLAETFEYALSAAKLCVNSKVNSPYRGLEDSFAEVVLAPYGLDKETLSALDPRSILTSLSLSPKYAIQKNNQFAPDQILGRYHDRRLLIGAKFVPNAVAAGSISGKIKISVLMPTYNSPPLFLQRAILSLLNQTYANWQLCIFDDASSGEATRIILRKFAALDQRIKVVFGKKNGGISYATNGALSECDGDFVGLLDHDDVLTSDALEIVAAAIEAKPADVYYSDECKIDENDIVCEFFSKPDWSPLLLINYMYLGHFTLYRRAVISKLRFRSEFDFSQDYDLALRATSAKNVKVEHIEHCLYGWRMISGSAAQGDKPEARGSNIAALQSDIDRRGWIATVKADLFANAIQFEENHVGKVSIIVPSDSTANICDTVRSIRSNTSHPNFEILVVTRAETLKESRKLLTGQDGGGSLRFVEYNKAYNFSDKCNVGAQQAAGKYLIFFNDDVRVQDADWLRNILDFLTLDGVGAVGPKLLYENGLVQHGGMVTGVRRLVGTAFHTFKADAAEYFNFLQLVREVSLLCGACLAVRAELFERIGGFDAVNTPIMHSDVDLCLRIWEAGERCVYTPYACLTHIGHLSIGSAPKLKKHMKNKADIFIMKRFAKPLSRDPYFTASMRDMLYIDSQEPYAFFPGDRDVLGYESEGSDIVLFSHDLSASGAPKIVYDMACALRQRGDYVVVVSREDGPFRQRLVAIGVDVVIDVLVLEAQAYIVNFAKNFDVVIGNTVLTWRLAKALGGSTRVILYAHEIGLIDHYASMYFDFSEALGRASVVLAGSELSVSALRRLGIEAQRLEYGVKEPLVGEVARPYANGGGQDVLTICLFGTIEPRKGQDLAVLAFNKLPETLRCRSRLTIVGRVNDEQFYQAIRSFAAETPEIEFVGPLNLEDYHHRLACCDIVLCPSRDDTLPIVSLDALASGKTLIVSITTGTSAYIDHDVSGIILHDNSPTDIARAIISVSEASRRSSIGQHARNVYQRRFSQKAFESRFLSIVDGDKS